MPAAGVVEALPAATWPLAALDLLGVLVLAAAAGLGGGILRDVLTSAFRLLALRRDWKAPAPRIPQR